ncbi:AsmA family protein [Halieaceae bacterium IMCC14734]|uniref:AsmA family protein n=1 Tax=Candidatus Litorirhabdus singularis TaxID=2518993 RepID=A0ABT3TI47_9GAMM|nr:AsmA family protein [Candidatus Litorirhabdus singularis]MCX2982002.1 AsmA family protein [Candidatus Litorirhabdus singularis]
MKTLATILGVLVFLIIAAVVAIPMLISVDDLAAPIAAEVKTATGRELTVAGDTSLSVFPSLSVQLNDVSLSNMTGGTRDAMITMQQLDVHIPWLALFSGQLSVERFVIRQPNILLETDAGGMGNWNLGPTAEPTAEAPAEGGVALPAGFDINLGKVAIEDGSLTYRDGVTGAETQLSNLQLTVTLPSLHKELGINGALTYMDETFELSLAVNTLAKILGGEPFDMAASINSRLVTLDYAGNIAADASLTGSLNLQADSVKALMAWQQIDMESKDNALNQLTLGADISFGNDQLAMNQLKLTLDALTVTGSSTITLAETPAVKANIDLGLLDLNPYLPNESASEAGAPPVADAEAASTPIVWDDTTIDLSGLGAVNADIKLRTTGLVFQDIKLGETTLALLLQNSKLKVQLTKFEAYEGTGNGQITLNAASQPYRVSTRFDLTGIQAQPLLRDAAGFDKLMGNGQLNINLNTNGISQKSFIKKLAGNVGFAFNDGAVAGANIAQMLRSSESLLKGDVGGANLNASFDEAAQTDFSEMKGTLNFTNGVGINDDLSLASPLLRITGAGKVDLPATKVDYVVKARLVTSIEGQGGGKAKGVGIPIKVIGPFHDLSIKPDFSKAAENELKDRAGKELFKRFGR